MQHHFFSRVFQNKYVFNIARSLRTSGSFVSSVVKKFSKSAISASSCSSRVESLDSTICGNGMPLMYHGPMRAVTRADAFELARLETELFDESMLRAEIETEIVHGFGWLIEHEHELVGYILVRDDNYILDITRFGVRTGYQGQGMGTLLLSHVLRTLRPVMLSVDESNVVAMRMYLKNGFHIVGRLPHNSCWVMRR